MKYFVIDPSNGVLAYAGTADFKISTFSNFKPWATKLTHRQALRIARAKKHFKILDENEFADLELIASNPKLKSL